MRRNNTFWTVIIAVVLILSAYYLYPTFATNNIKNKATQRVTAISELTGLNIDEINSALTNGSLEGRIRQSLAASNSADKLESALADAKGLIALDDDLAKYEPRAIKRGLDLQGGSYLVYEVDLAKMCRDIAKSPDGRFDEIFKQVEQAATEPNVDFFEALQAKFAEADMHLSRYFGTRAQTDAEIVADLKKDADDAIARNLEILRNRIDQFGVSEPSITKQGNRRIVIELAGITDVGRAKNIIGKTALLEFQLLKDNEIITDVFRKIDQVVRQSLGKDSTEVARTDSTSASDSLAASSERGGKEVSIDEILGTDVAATEGDSTVVVDEGLLADNPFYSLFQSIQGDFGVRSQNVRVVERILNRPDVKSVVPPDIEFAWQSKPEQIGDEEFHRFYVLKKEAELTGTYLKDAQPQIGGGGNIGAQGAWTVSMKFDDEGTRIFSRVTGANVNKRLAIVLDGRVVMAPNIKERIPSGNAEISGSFGADEAKDLAVVLRAGSLQVPMRVIEERTVGPSLGKDSISKGQYSALIGFALVVIFMFIYYKLSGLIANVALLLNIVIVMAALAVAGATLTLPGIAGIILTIGMAVDANVLIFERIREELNGGKTVNAAINAGYDRAFSAILDANVTTFLTALVLYQFGTGPIRGFAITLSIGVIASMFTAIVVTRVIFDAITSRRRMATLSI